MKSFPYTSKVTYDESGIPIYDRASNSQEQRSFNDLMYTNGVDYRKSDAFLVVADIDMSIKVMGGWCKILGAFGYEKSEYINITIDESDTQDRIDRIILRNSLADEVRSIDIHVLKGVPSNSPTAQALTKNNTIYELALADIRVNANSIAIEQININDKRLDPDLCGILGHALNDIDFSPYYKQIQSNIDKLEKMISDVGSVVVPDSSITPKKIAPSMLANLVATATKTDNIVNITVYNYTLTDYTLTFTTPTDFDKLDEYTINGVSVTMLDSKMRLIGTAWVMGAVVSFNVSGDKCFFRGGGGDEIVVNVADTVDLHLGDKVSFSEFDGKWYNSIFSCYKRKFGSYPFTIDGANYYWNISATGYNTIGISLYNADTNVKICNDFMFTTPVEPYGEQPKFDFKRMFTLNGFEFDALLGCYLASTSYSGKQWYDIYRIKYNKEENNITSKGYNIHYHHYSYPIALVYFSYKKNYSYGFYKYTPLNSLHYDKKFFRINYEDDKFVKKTTINVENEFSQNKVIGSIRGYDEITYIQGAYYNDVGTQIYGAKQEYNSSNPVVGEIPANYVISLGRMTNSVENKIFISKYDGSQAVTNTLKAKQYKEANYFGRYCFDGEIISNTNVVAFGTYDDYALRTGAITSVSSCSLEDAYIEAITPLPMGDKFLEPSYDLSVPYCSQDENYKYYLGSTYMFKKDKHKRWIVTSINSDETITIKETENESVN